MKIKFLTTALVAIVGLAFIGAPLTVKAQSTNSSSATAPAKKKKAAKNPDYKGSITAISDTSLTVASTTKTLTLAITPATKFGIKNGKKFTPAKASDFAVGDAVTGSYTTDSTGAMTAYSVHKKGAATASTGTTTPAGQ